MTTVQEFEFESDTSDVQKTIESTLIWRFNNAINLINLITKKSDWYLVNYHQFWYEWFNRVFSLRTAEELGLTVWSILLDLPIQSIPNSDTSSKPIFGFESDAGTWVAGFGLNFYLSNFSRERTISLTVSEKRFLLLLRYFQLTCRGATPEINKFLSTIVGLIDNGNGSIYVIDNLDMSITYIFSFYVRDVFIDVLKAYDILPRPAGVLVKIIPRPAALGFGFGPDSGAWAAGYSLNFFNSNFG